MSPPEQPGVPRWLPHPLLLHVLVAGIILFAAVLLKGPWDSDYYWHIQTGQLIAEGQFPRTDPFSFTWAGMPWTLHEWLSELLLYRLVDGLGYFGAVLAFALIPGIVVAILAFALHRMPLRTPAVIVATSLAAFLVIPYATIRPQALSWIFVALLVAGLLHLRPDRARWTLVLVPMFVLWANLHGLWVVGLVILGLYAVMTLAGLTPMRTAWPWALAMLPLAAVGTVFTPEGPSILLYPLRYIDAGDWGAANITEWQSPDFHDPAHIPLLVFMGALAIFGRWRVPWWLSLLAFAGVAMTLLALRNGPVTAIIGAPALAVGIDAALRDWRPAPKPIGPRTATRRRMLETVMAVVVAVAGAIIFIPRDPMLAIQTSIERELPVQGTEVIVDQVPDGRIVAEYGWGAYVSAAIFEDGGRVMVDGRNDMYDDAILVRYGMIRDADEGWEAIADGLDADALLFPPYRAITKGPAEFAGWCEAFRDENEVLYLRTCIGP